MLRRLLLKMLAVAACATLTSCVPDEAGSRSPYIGPTRKAPVTGQVEMVKPEPVPESGPVNLTVTGAILMTIENNRNFAVQRLSPAISKANEDIARAAFDPSLKLEASRQRTVSEQSDPSAPSTGRSVVDKDAGKATLETFLPTGTSVALEGKTEMTDSSLYSDESVTTRAGLTITQSLLKGAGLGVNLASLRQAKLDSRASEYELRGLAESLVADVEKTCWEYVLAARQIDIYSDSLKLAEQQLEETRERIKVGKLADVEIAAAQAEVALRREDLINARSTLATTRLRLVRLLNLPGRDPWNREITISTAPAVPEVKLDDVAQHVAIASRMRTDLNQARLDIQRGELEIVKTRNGLLPKLDFFITLGNTGYASSFKNSARDVDGDNYDTLAGLQFNVPLGNREARARHLQAVLRLDQVKAALGNMVQLVELDVRSAYIEAGRTREQIAATTASRKLREETLRAETEKFRVGKSTSFLVAQAQRDLVASQISEVQAVVNHLKALIDLYRLEGSLLDRRGIEAPR